MSIDNEPDAPAVRRRHARKRQEVAHLRTLVIVGIAIRLVLAPFTSWERDIGVWFGASISGAHGLGLYSRPDFSYPPVWGNVLQAIGIVLSHLGLPPSSFARRSSVMSPLAGLNHFSMYITSPWFNLAFKTVLGAFDLGAALLVFALVLQLTGDSRRARWGFAIVFLNPVVIFESTVLGEFDIVVGTCILLAAFAAINRLPLLAGAAISLGTVVKVVPAVLIPILLVFVVLVGRRAPETPDESLAAAPGEQPGPARRGELAQARGAHRAAASRLGWVRRMAARGARAIWEPSHRGAVLDALSFLGGGIVVAVACMVPELASHGVSAMLKSTSARESAAPVSGGFSFYGLAVFKSLGSIKHWIQVHPGLGHELSDLATALVALVGLARLVRRGPAPTALLAIICGQIAALLLTSPQTQPQYLLWILPSVAVLAASCKVGRFELAVMTISPVALFIFIYSPVAFVFPLAAYTHALSLRGLTGQVTSWIANNSTGIWATRLLEIPASIIVPVVLAAFALLIFRALSFRAAVPVGAEPEDTVDSSGTVDSSSAVGSSGAAAGVSTGRLWQVAPRYGSALIAGCVVAGLLVVAVNGSGKPTGSVRLASAALDSKALVVSVDVNPGDGERSIRLTSFALSADTPAIRHLYVFDDPLYGDPAGAASMASSIGPHLADEFRLRRFGATVTTVDAAQLRAVFADTDTAATSAVVDITGALPESSYSPHSDLVLPWLDDGGVLVWAGALAGSYSSTPGKSAAHPGSTVRIRRDCMLECIEPARPGTCPAADKRCGGCIELVQLKQTACPPIGHTPIGGFAVHPTALAQDLQLSFRSINGTPSVYGSLLGGTDIGWGTGEAASIDVVAAGQGALVDFGGPIREVQDSSIDIANVIMSRAYDIAGAPSSTTVASSRFGSGLVDWHTSLASKSATGPADAEVYAIDPDLWGTVTGSWVVPQQAVPKR